MEQLAFWRNIAVVVLAVQCLLLLVLALAANYALMRLLHILTGKTGNAAHKVQQLSHTVAEKTSQIADKSIQPVLAIKGRYARVSGAVSALSRNLRSSSGLGGRSRRPSAHRAGTASTTVKEESRSRP